MSSMIKCRICGEECHAIQLHIRDKHTGAGAMPSGKAWTLAEYQRQFPDAPLLSQSAQQRVDQYAKQESDRAAALAAAPALAMAGTATVQAIRPTLAPTRGMLHEVFAVGDIPAAKSAKGKPIAVTILPPGEYALMVPDVDNNHVYELEILKNVMMAVELGMPLYGWGHAGTGKTTTFEQACARTNRPVLRVQHTINTEESHILGQWTVLNGQTVYAPGPLALAMRHGWVYLADEYDFGLPAVLAVYQPVLEGKSLVIKEAQGTEWGVVKPHPDFRFFATGNTNGSGDDTGLYQGTAIQNAANYDRFGMVIQFEYMDKVLETQAVSNQAKIDKADAEKLVSFAHMVRQEYDGGKISNTISPRTLINAARIGMLRGSWRVGLTLSFINKMSKVDREVVSQVAQRIFGAGK